MKRNTSIILLTGAIAITVAAVLFGYRQVTGTPADGDTAATERKVLYWTDPMVPGYRSDTLSAKRTGSCRRKSSVDSCAHCRDRTGRGLKASPGAHTSVVGNATGRHCSRRQWRDTRAKERPSK